jgi:hypothetical protein
MERVRWDRAAVTARRSACAPQIPVGILKGDVMPVERDAVKEIVDRFGTLKDAAESAAVSSADLKLWAIEATRDLAKAKEDELARILAKAFERVASSKDTFLKHAKTIESQCKLLEKQIADFKKAATAK